ncbi:hypothetical protein [Robertmurraya massiliosenegalensis]|uniref:hypothetical protein n=1 Tax=Robertmurraya massiliosenegalensis TaxID=1287657 RepID=UPI00030C4989|nr:hypothetical protein [Robertmurraya massiliosenegalensis]
MKNILNKDNLEAIRLYAIDRIYGISFEDRYNKEVSIVKNENTINLLINQKQELNTWGQGDIKVCFNSATNLVSFEVKEIDGENWGKSWYESYGKTITISELLSITESIAQKLLLYNLKKENEKLKKENENLKKDNSSLKAKNQELINQISEIVSSYSNHIEIVKKITKKRYFIPLLSKLKSYLYRNQRNLAKRP